MPDPDFGYNVFYYRETGKKSNNFDSGNYLNAKESFRQMNNQDWKKKIIKQSYIIAHYN